MPTVQGAEEDILRTKVLKKRLTPKQRLFVAEYLKDFNGTRAAIRAGYPKKTAQAIASENLRKPLILDALSQARNSIEKKEERALMEAYEVEAHLDALIRQNPKRYYDEDGNFKPIQDLSDEEAYAINEMTRIETEMGTHFKLKFESKLQAIVKKMERLGLMKQVVEVPALQNLVDLLTQAEERKRKMLREEAKTIAE